MTAGLSLFLDVQGTQDDVHPERGIPRYVGMHAGALVARPGAVSRVALNPAVSAPAQLPEELLTSPRLVWNTPGAFRDARFDGPLAYHIMSPFHLHLPFEAAIPAHAFQADALVVTLYDLIPLHLPATYLPDFYGRLYRSRLSVVQSADLVLTLSKQTSADAVERLGLASSRVVTIGAGVSPFFTRPGDGRASAELCAGVPGLSRPFLMTVSGHDTRKNTALLLRAFTRLPRSLRRALQVVVVGEISPEVHHEYLRVAREVGCADDEIVWAGRVSDAILRALYQRAEVFVFPSVLEGFGLPVLEAAACGCPSLTARASSLPDILEWAPSTFDPFDAGELAELLQQAIADTSFRAELTRAGDAAVALHTWEAVADRTLEAVGNLRPCRDRTPSERARPGETEQRRLAFVAPAADAGTQRVAEALRRYCDLEVYATDRTDGARRIDGVPTFPLEAFNRLKTPHSFDAIVHVDEASSDPRVRELARRAPSVIATCLHDAGDADELARELVAVANGLPADARVAR